MAINITQFTCARCFSNGTVDNTGTYLKVFLTFTAGASVTYRVNYVEDSGGTLALVRSGTGTSFNGSFVSSTAILNADNAYLVTLLITGDGIALRRANVPTSFVLLDINASGKGLGIGKQSSRANELEIGMPIYDRFDTTLSNGLTYYEGGGAADPNTTSEDLILTSTNTPIAGALFFVRTMFYSTKRPPINRTQYAYPYNSNARSTFYRAFHGGAWTAWVEQPVIVRQGVSGVLTWRKFSDGTGECFGTINLSAVPVNAALGTWYRSEAIYGATQYAYPIDFTEAPATEMTFQTHNGQGAMLWTFSSSESNARMYLPQCYIIRPTTATSVSGKINIYVKGNI